jgi:co-chaperonin GroES (HSP10)
MYEPPWKQYEEGIRSGDPKEQLKSLEAFEETREKEMAISKKARDWETSRKEVVAKEKPKWVKEKRKEETAELDSFTASLKEGGSIEKPVTPMPGYVLVKPDEAPKETASGIYIEQESTEVNTGRIVEVGTDLIMEKNILPCPVQIGDHIYHKKFAGMSLLVNGESCKLMQFTDLLMKIDD